MVHSKIHKHSLPHVCVQCSHELTQDGLTAPQLQVLKWYQIIPNHQLQQQKKPKQASERPEDSIKFPDQAIVKTR